jgi:hypothetical protein
MPTFRPVRPYYAPPGTPRVRQGARLADYYPANFFVPTPGNIARRGYPNVTLGRLNHYNLGAIDPTIFSGAGLGPTPPPPPAPGLPAGYDPSTGMITAGASGATPPVQIGPMAPSVPAGTLLAPGTFLTYTVSYELGASGAFTSNDEAIASIQPMLAGVGLAVTSVQTPSTLNPLSANQAVIGLQVQGAGMTLQQAKNYCDNAIVAGLSGSVLSSSLVVGQPSGIMTWLTQNWMWVAAGAAAVLILPKILDDFI